jgi:tRNA threonylcarbamoyladenosine biosynthesis protein TsaB
MLIITFRTDKPEAEVGLFQDDKQLAYLTWQAHRKLAETIHQKIAELLKGQGHDLHDLQAIAVYEGPGSFTGLRIGLSVANALAYSLKVPIASATGEDWIKTARTALGDGRDQQVALPEYGAEPHITQQRK